MTNPYTTAFAHTLDALRPVLAAAAQPVYDAWEQDAEGVDFTYGGGGICDAINAAMQDVLTDAGVRVVDGGQDGDDHAYSIAFDDAQAFIVDIPPHVYETGGGYAWRKVPGVVFTPDVVTIAYADLPPEDMAALADDAGDDW